MVEHLSELALERQAIGEGPASPHLGACDTCRLRVETLQAGSRRLLESPGYSRTLEALDDLERRVHRSRSSRWALWLAPLCGALATATAAGVLLRIGSPMPETDCGIKGRPSLAVVRAGTAGERVHRARPGDRVALQVGTGAAPYLLVVALEASSKAEVLWPVGASASAPAPRGAAVRLAPDFTITPGSLTVRAIFSDRPLSLVDAQKPGGAATVVDWDVCVEGSPCPSP